MPGKVNNTAQKSFGGDVSEWHPQWAGSVFAAQADQELAAALQLGTLVQVIK